MRKYLPLLLIAFLGASCSQKTLPYENGPVMTQKSIKKTFQPILDFMDYKPGMTFADVGAGSGAITVMMSSLMKSSVVYIQDIDTTVLNQSNLDKIITYYSTQGHADLRTTNEFHQAIGSFYKTNLPNNSFDIIYSNGTVHNFTEIDSIMTDLGRKLKPNGVLFLRDSFRNDHGEGEYCSDPKCGGKLLTIDELLEIMKRNHFQIVKQSPDMSGYPVFAFKK